jgi:hypothetical protein
MIIIIIYHPNRLTVIWNQRINLESLSSIQISASPRNVIKNAKRHVPLTKQGKFALKLQILP